ncbi:hypothetical protein F4859DRAFT_482870 [Xylaria cf. heliscus]|nr:hypothetical protein F4859DRAFT_482870 [Xylaria cf. heliscus]
MISPALVLIYYLLLHCRCLGVQTSAKHRYGYHAWSAHPIIRTPTHRPASYPEISRWLYRVYSEALARSLRRRRSARVRSLSGVARRRG